MLSLNLRRLLSERLDVRHILRISIALICLLPMSAEAYVELNTFYFSDAFTNSAASNNSDMFVEGSIGFGIDSKKQYLVGWNYAIYSVNQQDTVTKTYSSTQMGPRFLWRFGGDQAWSVGLAYNLINNATYADGSGTTVKWKGSAIKADVGYAYPLVDNVTLGLRLNYSIANYTEQLTDSNVYSKVSYSRTHLFPSLALFWLW